MNQLNLRCVCSSLQQALLLLLSLVLAFSAQANTEMPGGFSEKAAIEQRLKNVQTELQQHAEDADPITHEMLKRLEAIIFQHLVVVDFLAETEKQRDQALATTRAWSGVDQAGPWSILFADDLRIRFLAQQKLQQAADARIRVITHAMEKASDQLASYKSEERRISEMTESAGTAASRHTARIAAIRNEISSRTALEEATFLKLRQRGVYAQLATFKANQELLELQLHSIEDQLEFSKPELEAILERIAKERTEARAAIESSDSGALEADSQMAWLAEFLTVEETFWNTRYAAQVTSSVTERRKVIDTFSELDETVKAWLQIGRALVGDQLIESEESLDSHLLKDELKRLTRLQNLISFAIAEQEGGALGGIALLDRVVITALALWNAELYLAEDTTSVDGQKITTYRAITLSKLIWLAIILTVGWFVLQYLSRRIRKWAQNRPGSSPEKARSLGRWTFGVGLGLLIIYGMNRVHIPFTAFAFLGGTLAIGIGFGAQTLIKNFISGIILSLERPFKVGDYIEVDNVTGQIRSIGMRASVIEHFDGIETLLPNSTLLENRVDNWTYGRTAIRGSVSVGVAYGSPTRDVSRSLLAAANEHGQVLDRPEPEVRFEEFGDNALVFRLLYWVDATKTQRERLASDLRFMIDKTLNEAGIVVSFPQRDIHFDTGQPLRVEITSPGDSSTP